MGSRSPNDALRAATSSRNVASQIDLLVGLGSARRPYEWLTEGGFLIFRTEGGEFCGPRRDDRATLRSLGLALTSVFLRAAELIDCAYGAILVEYSMETPAELRQSGKSLAFRNFYLSTDRVSHFHIDRIMDEVPVNAYVQRLRRGIYVSMSAEFNPEAKFIALIRNPVDMAISWHGELLRNITWEDVDDFQSAC